LRAILLLASVVGLTACDGIFFQPNDRFYYAPESFDLAHDEVWFESGDGTRLHAWHLPAVTDGAPPLGTIVFFHGNAANITNHVYAVRWLPRAGYRVFLFDYRGYGESEGDPDRATAIADGAAAISYARAAYPGAPLIVYGQSLGGALAIAALAEAGTARVGALVVEASFRSYREVARLVMDRAWLTWPFQYPVSWLFFSDDLSPTEFWDRIADVPTLVVHREGDGTVPFEAGRRLFESLPAYDKTFWPVPGEGHITTFTLPEPGRRTRLIRWLGDKLGVVPEPEVPGM
jgi:hypothetical protein